MSGGYTIYTLLLTSAGSEFIPGLWQLARVLRAVDSTGAIYPQALIEVRTGKSNEDYFPLAVGNAFVSKPGVDGVNIKWAAQSGITVTIGLSADASRIDWQSDPPAQVSVITGTVATEETLPSSIVESEHSIGSTVTHTPDASAVGCLVFVSKLEAAGTVTVREGTAGTRIAELEPGDSIWLPGTAGFRVLNASGTATVFISEFRR